jgi:Ricin-type beta-trefoil lectin domain-like
VSDSVFNRGWRSLRAAHSARDVARGSTCADTYLEQRAQIVNHPDQQFTFQHQHDGYHRIFVSHSDKVLDVAGASRAHGAAVTKWGRHGGPNQQWAAVRDPVRFDDN